MPGAYSYAPRRRFDDEEEEKAFESYTYGAPTTYAYGEPSTEEAKLDLDGLYSYSGAQPGPTPTSPEAAAPVPAQALPKGDDDDFASFFKGGRISSRAMRAYEVAQRKKEGGGPPPAPAASPSRTEQKRAAIAAAIPKTPKYNAKGEDLDAVVNGTGGLRGTRLIDEYKDEDKKVGWRGKNVGKQRFAEHRGLALGTPEFDQAFQAFVEGNTTVTDYERPPKPGSARG